MTDWYRKLNPFQGLVLSFGAMIFVGAILLSLPVSWEKGVYLSFLDAFFTATSAVCVTGLIVVDTPTTYSTFGEIVILLLIQTGGIGIVTFATIFIVLMGQDVTYRNKLILKESYSLSGAGSVIKLTLLIIKFTLLIEGIGAALLLFLFAPYHGYFKSIYLAIFHSVSAFCNAGFSLFSNSLEDYMGDWGINIVIMLLIILGGLGFPVLAEIFSIKRGHKLSIRAKIVLTTSAFLIVAGALILHLFALRVGESGYYFLSNTDKFLTCIFQSVTARTAGFNTINLNAFPHAALLVIIALMFIGGSPTSTSGGIKTTTFWLIIMGAWNYFRGNESIRVSRKEIELKTFQRAVVLAMVAFMLLLVCSGLLIYFGEGTLFNLIFEAVSAFGTVGLSLGATPELNSVQKLIIIALMFIGRVGPISFAFIFFTRRKVSMVKYPTIDIPTG